MLVMKGFSGGNGKWPNPVAFSSCNAQPRNDSKVPDVSLKPNTPPVARNSCWPTLTCSEASAPSTLVSSPTQELIAEGVMLLTTLHAPPVECSSEISGHINPARAEKNTLLVVCGR